MLLTPQTLVPDGWGPSQLPGIISEPVWGGWLAELHHVVTVTVREAVLLACEHCSLEYLAMFCNSLVTL